MDIDKDLMEYCINEGFPVDEMDEEQFKAVSDTDGFNSYKLGILLKGLGKDILSALKKIEYSLKKIDHRKKSCKNFKCK